jgi:selenocysteine-specific elongation factor
LAGVLSATESPRNTGKPRLPVDRVFTLKGIGTVVTGTLMGGKLTRGQAVVVQPRGATARIRTVQTHNAEIESAQPGSRTALNIPDLQAHETVQRGDVVTVVELGATTSVLNVILQKSARVNSEKLSSLARPLRTAIRVRVHHGTTDVAATVLLLDQKHLGPGGTAFAQLRLEADTFAFVGDRFIIRDWSEQTTLAGGTILDVHGNVRDFRTEAQRVFLEKTSAQITNAAGVLHALLERDHFCRSSEALVQANFSSEQISKAVAQLTSERKLQKVGEWLVESGCWAKLRGDAAAMIDAAHKARPDAPGMLLSDLRSHLESSPRFPADLFNAVVAELAQNGFVHSGEKIRRASHQLVLPPQLQAVGARLRSALAAKPLDPPARKELAPDALSQQALRFLINSGEAVELNAEVALSSRAFAQALDIVRKFFASKQTATVSDLRQALGTSRRIVVPLLEKLDRDGITRRVGDQRMLREKP